VQTWATPKVPPFGFPYLYVDEIVCKILVFVDGSVKECKFVKHYSFHR
jgi:hypothetical protein